MNIRIPGYIFKWVLLVCVVLGVLATTLDLIGFAFQLWTVTLPALLVIGAAVWWALERWDKYDPDAPPPPLGQRIGARLVQTVLILVMIAIGVGAVVALGHFLWTHKDYLFLSGLVLVFFVGVALWPQEKRPAETAPTPSPGHGGDIVT